MILEQLSVANIASQVSTDLWRETSIILKIDAPFPAADVRKLAGSEWPENVLASAVQRAAEPDQDARSLRPASLSGAVATRPSILPATAGALRTRALLRQPAVKAGDQDELQPRGPDQRQIPTLGF
jgi:hypothetical protein